jgi:ATPase subunit of ABC transporter with duplicated ATPase domains
VSSSIAVSNLAYAHPGGDLLFDGVSFRLSPRRHAGLIRANGVGKTTLMRILAGELQAMDGNVANGGPAAYMPQDVGAGDGTVRELLLSVAPDRVRETGLAMLRAERELEAGDDAAGVRLGEAIASWSDLGGYELEGQWDSACRRCAGGGLGAVGDRPAETLSGGERKRLVLDLLFASDAQVLLLDEPTDNLDIDSSEALESALEGFEGTVVAVSHDRAFLRRLDRFFMLEQDGVVTVLPDARRALEAIGG